MVLQADRISGLGLSPIRQANERARELERTGADVVRLTQGEPYFDTPESIVDAARDGLARGLTHYTQNSGSPELREAVAEYYGSRTGSRWIAPANVVVTPGVSSAIETIALALIDPGDRVLVPDPGFLNYGRAVALAGGRAIPYRLIPETGYDPDWAELEMLFEGPVRMVFVTNPSNPTGHIWSRDTLQRLLDIAARHGALVVSDEIYDRLYYGDSPPVSAAALDFPRDRLMVLNGFSKAFAMTGWRLGYAVCGEDIAGALVRVIQSSFTCVSGFVQHAGVAALQSGEPAVEAMRAEYARSRSMMMGLLEGIPDLHIRRPDGAFYCFVDVSAFHADDVEWCDRLLREQHVAAVPGSAFGANGAGHVRLSFAAPEGDIIKGIDRIRTFCASLDG